MKFFLDESADFVIAQRLREDGHTVTTVVETVQSISDQEVLAKANVAEAILITSDKDFGELVYHQKTVVYGVVLLRLEQLKPLQKAEVVARIISAHASEMIGAFTVIDIDCVHCY
jgi:predicted nuclease of predicted toxin-antitoxin system